MPYLLPRLDKAQMSCTTHSPWIGGRLADRASDVFKAHVRVNPFPEEDHARLFEWLRSRAPACSARTGRIPRGFPSRASTRTTCPRARRPKRSARMMRDNARELLGLADEKGDLVDRLNHVKIVTPEPEAVDRFLREVLEVPEGWPIPAFKRGTDAGLRADAGAAGDLGERADPARRRRQRWLHHGLDGEPSVPDSARARAPASGASQSALDTSSARTRAASSSGSRAPTCSSSTGTRGTASAPSSPKWAGSCSR